jgi:hypothetical protein
LSAPSTINAFTRDTLLVTWKSGITGGVPNTYYKIEWDTLPTFDTKVSKPFSFEFEKPVINGTSPEVAENGQKK